MFYNMYQIINSIQVYKHLCDRAEGGGNGTYKTFLQGLWAHYLQVFNIPITLRYIIIF